MVHPKPQEPILHSFNKPSHLLRHGITRRQVPLSAIFPTTLPPDSDPDFQALLQYFNVISKPYSETNDPVSLDLAVEIERVLNFENLRYGDLLHGQYVEKPGCKTEFPHPLKYNHEAIKLRMKQQDLHLTRLLRKIVDLVFDFLRKRKWEKEEEESIPLVVMQDKINIAWKTPKQLVAGYKTTALGGVMGPIETPAGFYHSWGLFAVFQLVPRGIGPCKPCQLGVPAAIDAGALIGQAVHNLYKSKRKDRETIDRDSICITIHKTSVYFSRATIRAEDIENYRRGVGYTPGEREVLYSDSYDFCDEDERKEMLRGIMAVFEAVRTAILKVLETDNNLSKEEER
ncbi:hypothetical protein TWF281_008993 [Arthrobotrys megalospora]